jgi:hypothetical protein
MSSGRGLVEDGQDPGSQRASSMVAQFHGHPRPRAETFVNEIQVERVLERGIERVVERDVYFRQFEPPFSTFAASINFDLVCDHRAHGKSLGLLVNLVIWLIWFPRLP